ncbi:MAG: D-alanyl-D-alanine carboxypeptidase family protein [Clostridia bacterium]
MFSIFPITSVSKIEHVSAANLSSAKGMCVIEKDSKRVIYSKNMNDKMPMASTTKIMTTITVLQHCDDLDEIIKVDDSAIGVEGTSIYLREEEMISVRDLLYGLMLRSGNDAATALACYIGGDVAGFAKMMNELANKIGATNSNFMNPHGLHHDNHYTTAYDLALISAYALNNPIFKEIVSTKSHIIEETNVSDKRYLTNKNKLLSSLEGCCGVKTGFTKKAGRCLVSSCERDDTTYVCVVLNCGPMFEESRDLLNNCFINYKNTKIIDKNREIYNEYFIDENSGKLYLYTNEDFYYPLKNQEYEKIKIKYNITLNDAKIGENVGEIQIFFENDLIKTLKLYTMNKIDKLIDANTLQISEILWEERINENQ